MRSFYYRPGRNAATALVSGALAILAASLWWRDGDIWWLLTLLLCGASATQGAMNAFNTEPALKFDNERLWVRTAFGRKVIPWSKVYGIALQVMTIRYWGIVPISRRETLCIACEGGSFGARRLRVPAAAVELPVGGAQELVQILRDAQLAAVGVTGVAMAGAGRDGWGVPAKTTMQSEEPSESGFDADAAIARYLASKQVAQNAPAGVQPQPASPTAMPQRPVFGRRQAS